MCRLLLYTFTYLLIYSFHSQELPSHEALILKAETGSVSIYSLQLDSGWFSARHVFSIQGQLADHISTAARGGSPGGGGRQRTMGTVQPAGTHWDHGSVFDIRTNHDSRCYLCACM